MPVEIVLPMNIKFFTEKQLKMFSLFYFPRVFYDVPFLKVKIGANNVTSVMNKFADRELVGTVEKQKKLVFSKMKKCFQFACFYGKI